MYHITMRKLVPQNDSVICIQVQDNHSTPKTGFVYEKPELPLYKVESIGAQAKSNELSLKPGDIVTANSTGTLAVLDDVKYYIFKIENIVGKISE